MDRSERPICLEETRVEHIRFISEWVASQTDERVLWVVGVAGAGKSTLVNTIANDCIKTGNLGAQIYFTRGRDSHNKPAHTVKTIAYQLAKFDPSLRSAIAEVIKSNGQTLASPLETQFDTLIAEPVGRAMGLVERGSVVIIVDALDECGSFRDRESFIKILSRKVNQLPHHFRFIITGRPENDLEAAFKASATIRRHEIAISADASKRDVEIYVRSRLEGLRERENTDWPSEDHIIQLAGKADGLFVWASTACNYIDDVPLKETLDNIINLPGSKPLDSLPRLYETALATDSWKQPVFRDLCRAVLGAIFTAKEPLSCAEIASLLGREQSAVRMVARFKSVLRWSDTEPIRPHHASFTDYITDPELCKDKAWFVDIPAQNRVLADLCIDHLTASLKENVLGMTLAPKRAHPWKGVCGSLPEAVTYACRYWIGHASPVPASDERHAQLPAKVHTFLNTHLLHWIEVMSILDQSRSCVILLETLHMWLPVSAYSLVD